MVTVNCHGMCENCLYLYSVDGAEGCECLVQEDMLLPWLRQQPRDWRRTVIMPYYERDQGLDKADLSP